MKPSTLLVILLTLQGCSSMVGGIKQSENSGDFNPLTLSSVDLEKYKSDKQVQLWDTAQSKMDIAWKNGSGAVLLSSELNFTASTTVANATDGAATVVLTATGSNNAQLQWTYSLEPNSYNVKCSFEAKGLENEMFGSPLVFRWLLNGLAQRYPRGGNVNLTLDAALQRQAMDLARAHRQVLAQLDVRGLAIVGLAPGSDGRPEARIYIGNTEGSDPIGGQVDAVLAARSPGSALKPFLYGFAIDQGELLPKQWLEDIPTRFGDFSPENATSSYEGAVAADEALCRSLNVPFVRLLRTVGVSPFLDQLHRMGFHHLNYSADHYGLSLILGGGEVTLDELTSAYASLLPQVSPGPTRVSYGVASGTRIGFGASDENFLPGGATAFPVSTAARRAILNALSLPLRTEEEAWRTALAPDRPLAWKTGTSFGQRDAWAIGLTPRFCAGVWAGNPSGEGRAGLWGARSAAPLLFRILNLMEAVDRSPGPTSFQSPDTGARVEICALTGFRAGPNCPKREKVLAPSAGATAPVCPWHRRIQVTRDGHYRVRPNCAGTEISHDTVVLNLPGSIAAYLRQRRGDVALSPPWAHGCDAGEEREALEILYPDPGAILHTGRGFNGKRQHVVFEAGHRDPKAVLHWFLDGIYLGETTRFHTQSAEVETGSHALVVSDEEGRTAGVEFTVGKGI